MKKNKEHLHNAFPVAYIENGLNATRAYKAVKTKVKLSTANVEGSRLLAIPSIQERIRALLPSEEIESGVIRDAITADVEEPMTWRDKHKYLETSLKLKGLLNTNQDNKGNVNVGIIIER